MLQRTRERTQDNLISAETVDGGKLEAATRKEDQRILVHIQDKDFGMYYLRNMKHFSVFPYTVISTRVEFGKTRKTRNCGRHILCRGTL